MSAPVILLNPIDNVLVAVRRVALGEVIDPQSGVASAASVPLGHKLARYALPQGAVVIKLGVPIGILNAPVAAGAHIHSHNLDSAYTRAMAFREKP